MWANTDFFYLEVRKLNGKEVVMRLRIDTILGDMSKAINGLQEGLSKGVSKIDIGSQIGKNLTKNIQQFKEEYTKFSQLTSGGTSLKMSNSKEAVSGGERLIKVYRDIQAQYIGKYRTIQRFRGSFRCFCCTPTFQQGFFG